MLKRDRVRASIADKPDVERPVDFRITAPPSDTGVELRRDGYIAERAR